MVPTYDEKNPRRSAMVVMLKHSVCNDKVIYGTKLQQLMSDAICLF